METIELTIPGDAPREIIVNGRKYRRIADDSATEILMRIHEIAESTHCSMAQAAWAIHPDFQNFPSN